VKKRRDGQGWLGVVLGGALLCAGIGGVALLDLDATLLPDGLPAFFACMGAATAGWIWAAVSWSRRASTSSDRAMWGALALGALLRLTLVACTPALSDDVYRYVWDGRVQASGVNPYSHPPRASALATLRDDAVHPKINHPGVRTIYPPAAEMVFAAARGPLDGVTGFKVLFVAFDLATCFLLWRILRRRGRAELAIWYAWCPLVLVEIAHSGHMDALVLFWLVLALERADAGRTALAGAFLGIAAATKLFALALLPFLARRNRWVWALAPLALFACFLPYWDAGKHLASGLGTYAGAWRFNETAFAALHASLRASLGGRDWNLAGVPAGYQDPHAEHFLRAWEANRRAPRDQRGAEPRASTLRNVFDHLDEVVAAGGDMLAGAMAKLRHGSDRRDADAIAHGMAQGIALASWGAWIAFLWRRRCRAEHAALSALVVLLLVSAAVQPWYVTWLVPLAALALSDPAARAYERAMAAAALTFAATAPLAYSVFLRDAGGAWQVPLWARTIEYGVPVVTGVVTFLRARAAMPVRHDHDPPVRAMGS
jgi:hypothetical protein